MKPSFGINILKVSKIINNLVNFTQMPDAHPAISGIFRDMDRVVPVVDLAGILGIGQYDGAIPEKLLETEFFGMYVAFRVDRVDWIHHFGWEDVINAEHVFGSLTHKYTIGIVKPTEDRMVQLLDYETILLDLSPHPQMRNEKSYEGGADFAGKKVLVAEDSPAVRAMLVAEMSDLGFEVTETNDGQSERSKTPVIVYSSIGDVGMKARAKFLDVDAHITKLNLNQLLETADKLLRGDSISDDIWDEETQERFDPATVPLD